MGVKEQEITIEGPDVKLEGLLTRGNRTPGVLVAHPHPQNGGNMFNNVVAKVCETFYKMGYWTLRFNFRGVGLSTGEYGDGLLEQDDYMYALDAFSKHLGKRPPIVCAGYSFGSYVVYKSMERISKPSKILLIAPPLNVMDFDYEYHFNTCHRSHEITIIIGDSDEFCSKEKVEHFAKHTKSRIKILKNVNHYFRGSGNKLEQEIKTCFQ